uniref:Uncharacterized protein n=1 Tax=Rhizophora mucronata TaxID=61149 RepID=A0A2P2Q522_RHIMU
MPAYYCSQILSPVIFHYGLGMQKIHNFILFYFSKSI